MGITIAGKYSEFSCCKACLHVLLIVCLFFAMLNLFLILMHCEGGEFSEFESFKPKPHALFILWFVFSTIYCLFQCAVDY